jgi:lysosomal acid lipase/cholesteryl ester hydrolase
MYDDGTRPLIPSLYQSHIIPHYALSHIKVPIAMFYGGADSLPHFESILDEVKPVFVHKVEEYEHLCFMWARDAHQRVFPHVVRLLQQYNVEGAAMSADM